MLPRRFEKLPVHVFSDRYEKLASDMVSGDVSRAFIEIIADLLPNTLRKVLFLFKLTARVIKSISQSADLR